MNNTISFKFKIDQMLVFAYIGHIVTVSVCSSACCTFKGRRKRESKNKKQETKRFSTFAVSRLRHSETKKNIA